MLVIRLLRIGKRNQPSFKIIVNDKRRSSKAGRYIEEVGFWNPLTKQKVLKLERIKYWISVGAEPSASLHNLFIKEKVIIGKKIAVHKKGKKKVEAATAAPAVPVAKPAETPVSASPEKPVA